jgi:hypothetical protein
MRDITITTQEYLKLGLINNLSYEILPYKEPNVFNNFFSIFGIPNNSESFPFKYILYYNDVIIKESKGYITPEEKEDWSVYKTMDDKIKGKLELL